MAANGLHSEEDDLNIEPAGPEVIRVVPKGSYTRAESPPSTPNSNADNAKSHGVVEYYVATGSDVPGIEYETARNSETATEDQRPQGWFANFRAKRNGWGRYIRTRQFWFVLVFGQVLSLCITGTSTLSELLALSGNNIPAFQNLFNYVLLCLTYTPITLYKYGFKGWGKMVWKDGWKYFILAFVDVQGNYFTVLAYDYTNILSASLINFWAIGVVVLVGLIFLKVRYAVTQYIGILVCFGGLGILLGSDKITGYNSYSAPDALKGDLFALLGATCYGFSNILSEVFVSKRPIYEVLGQLSFWAVFINGVQCAIFNRSEIQNATWTPAVGGYFAGYTLILFMFYGLVEIMFRFSSAAFLNLSLLTSSFWSLIVGIKRFHLHVHFLYPIAFVCIILGMAIYFVSEGVLGDSYKPWLGEEQEKGVDGVGTAKRRIKKAREAQETAEDHPHQASA